MASFKTVYTTKGENPAAIINEVASIEEDLIKLYLPEAAAFFEDRANFELLKREADFLGKEVIVVTVDKNGRGMAEAAGFSTQVPTDDAAAGQASRRAEEPMIEKPEKVAPKRFVDISGGGKKGLSAMEPVKSQEVISLKDLEDQAPEGPTLLETDEHISSQEAEVLEEREQELDTFLATTQEKTNKPAASFAPRRSMVFERRWAGAALLVLIVGYVGAVYLPKATIKVTSARQAVNLTPSVVVDKNLVKVNREANRVPGQILETPQEVTLTQSFPATGSRMSSGKAQGTVTLYNEQLTAQALIPSRLQSDDTKKVYWTQKNIVVPSAKKNGTAIIPGTLDAEVIANDQGDGSSVACSVDKPCRLSVLAWLGTDRGKKIYAKATSPISGGGSGAQKLVTDNDMKNAQSAIQDALKKAAQETLTKLLAPGLRIIPESVSVDIGKINADKTVGTVADSFAITASAKARAVAVNDTDIKTFIDETVQAHVSQDKRTYPDTVAVTFSDVSVNIEKGEVQLTLAAAEQVGWQFSVDELKKEFQGKTYQEVNKLAQTNEKIAHISYTLWPFWVRHVPKRLNNIALSVE